MIADNNDPDYLDGKYWFSFCSLARSNLLLWSRRRLLSTTSLGFDGVIVTLARRALRSRCTVSLKRSCWPSSSMKFVVLTAALQYDMAALKLAALQDIQIKLTTKNILEELFSKFTSRSVVMQQVALFPYLPNFTYARTGTQKWWKWKSTFWWEIVNMPTWSPHCHCGLNRLHPVTYLTVTTCWQLWWSGWLRADSRSCIRPILGRMTRAVNLELLTVPNE